MRPSFRDIVREASTASNLDDVLATIVRRVKASLSVDACAVYLSDVQGRHLSLMSSSGLGSTSEESVRTAQQPGLPDLVMERRELIVLTNAMAHPRYFSSPETADRRYDAFLGIPLIHDQDVLGVLTAWKAHAHFDRDEVTFFVTISAQLAKIIHEAAAAGEVKSLLRHPARGGTFIQGVQAATGLAVGTAALLDPLGKLESVPDQYPQDVDAEESAFRVAVAAAQREIHSANERLTNIVHGEARELFDVYSTLLGSDDLVESTIERIRAGNWAPGAWRDTIGETARLFDQLDDPYLSARGQDIREIGECLLRHLRSEVKQPRPYPERCILVGDRVSITEIAAVPVGGLAGIVSRYGSALSHSAILARAMGIPAVVSLSSLPLGDLDGRTIAVDGDLGRIYVQPSHAVLDAFDRRISQQNTLIDRLKTLHDFPPETPDGFRLPLYANIGLVSDIESARASGADGVGLYRTEYQFLLGDAFPIEEEQYEVYRQLLQAFAPNPVTIRTLDVGGDKILPYFPVEEENPFLGCRGIRFSLAHPEIFMIQLRAMLRANAGLENLHVLFPMVARIGEVDDALELLARAHRELLEEGYATPMPRAGVMIEIPSAVFLTKALADRVDFISVGTNDLAQYMLAVDRNNKRVARPYDSLHPAVLSAIHKVAQDAHGRNTPVSVCGEMAGDPAGALLLLGMGVDVLSMSPASLSRVKLVIRTFTVERARTLVENVLDKEDELSVHRVLKSALEEAGLFLIGAGGTM
jgi:phosphotransferase system enzyme I (PtsP)